MEEKMDNQSHENNSQNKKDPKESIPLWLQGLSERQESKNESVPDEWLKEEEFLDDVDESSEIEEETTVEDESTKEVIEHEPEVEVEADVDAVEEEDLDQDDIPDWLNELADVSPEPPNVSGQQVEQEAEWVEEVDEFDKEETEEVEIPSMQGEEEIEDRAEEQPLEQEEELEEIASLEAEDFSEEEAFGDEEIPEWLREMIAVEERHIQIESQKLAEERADEPTKPVKTEQPSEPFAEEPEEVEAPEEETIVAQDVPSDEQEESGSSEEEQVEEPDTESAAMQEVEIFEAPPNEGFQLIEELIEEDNDIEENANQEPSSFPPQPDEAVEPEAEYEFLEDVEASITDESAAEEVDENLNEVEPNVDVEEPMTSQEEATPWNSIHEPTEPEKVREDLIQLVETPDGTMPKYLVAAKSALEEGDVDNALDIIYGYISKPDTHEFMKSLLHATIEAKDSDISKLWEAIGDIAMQEGKHTEAFDAYSKAIRNLENIEG